MVYIDMILCIYIVLSCINVCLVVSWLMHVFYCFFFSSRRRHTRCALVTGVQTCALPILGDRDPPCAEERIDPDHYLHGAAVRRAALRRRGDREIGRASCRERVCQYV